MGIRAPAIAILGLNILLISLPSLAQQSIEICDEITDGILPYDNHIRGEIPIGDGEIRSNLVIAGGLITSSNVYSARVTNSAGPGARVISSWKVLNDSNSEIIYTNKHDDWIDSIVFLLDL